MILPSLLLYLSDAQRASMLALARSGKAFQAGVERTAVGGSLSHLQLLNPAGSSVRVQLLYAWISAASQANLTFRSYDTALATLVSGSNALLGGAAPIAQPRFEAIPTANIVGVQLSLWRLASPEVMEYPYVLNPGKGLVIKFESTGVSLIGSFFWTEQPT